MNREMTVRALVCLLKEEITQRQALLDGLEERLRHDAPAARETSERPSVPKAAVEILREAGRPMHGLDEIIPAHEARGLTVKSKAGFATLLLRTRKIVRRAPGTFGLAPDALPPG